KVEIEAAVKCIRAGLGDDLNARISPFRELSRVWILINADSQNSFFWWKLAALAKAAYVNGSIVGATCSAGHLFERLKQLIRVVWQRFDILLSKRYSRQVPIGVG